MKNVSNKPRFTMKEKAKHTVKLTKETRKPRTAKNARSKCDLLGRLTNETDKQK